MIRCTLVPLAVLMLVTASTAAQQSAQPLADLSRGGYSIFHETMVDLSYDEIEAAARRGAIVLWPLGVIEEHGPHLPLGTDIYNSYLGMKRVARLLRERGIETLIAPPLYWGINEATGSFGGSFLLRPSTLKAIIEDTFQSLRKDGFQSVYITTGHGDGLHNRTILDGVRDARAITGLRGFVVLNPGMQQRLGLTGDEPHVLLVERGSGASGGAPSLANAPSSQTPAPTEVEVHAGGGETSVVWAFFPDLVKQSLVPTLKPTRYGPPDLAEWRKGWENARIKTPLGYFGDPASADPKRGLQSLERGSAQTAEQIAEHVRQSPWNRQKQ